MGKIKVMIADDQELLRYSLKILIDNKPDIEVSGLAEDGRQLLEMIEQNKPDVVLLDIRMPNLDGIECTKIIKQKYPMVKIIILTTFEDDEYVFHAIKYGANGYLLKGMSPQELVESIRVIYKGGALINPNIAVKVFNYFSQMATGDFIKPAEPDIIHKFNRTELKIIQFIGMGLSNKDIAKKTNFSEGTIRNYISEILNKTGLRDRTQLAIFSIQTGINMNIIKE